MEHRQIEKRVVMTEKEIMLSGGMYDCLDKELVRGRDRAHVLAQQLNALPADDHVGARKTHA